MKTPTIFMLMLFFVSLHASAQTKINAEEALTQLKKGNERFVNNERKFEHLSKDRLIETSEKGQHPFATLITCSDSRVPVEHIFDAGIGDVFVIRVAGNVVDTDEAGSIEYGVEHLHTPIFVVLGHTNCGAVTAVVKDAEVHGNIPKLVDNIIPAVDKAEEAHGHDFSEQLLSTAIVNNVWQSVEDLLSTSHISKELVSSGKLIIVGAIYHMDTGEVEWLGEHPQQKELLTKNIH